MSTTGKQWARTGFSVVVIAVLLLPVYFIGIFGFMSTSEIYSQPPFLLPPNPTLDYYFEALTVLQGYLFNSVFMSAGVVLLTLLVAAPAAFALAKLRVRAGGLISLLMAFVQMLPVTTIVIPLFLLFESVGLANNRLGVILSVSSFTIPLNVIILTAYMRSIPDSLIEAAYLDGANTERVFRLLIPIMAPGLATGAMFAFLLGWSDFVVSMSMLTDGSLQPMSVGLYDFISQYGAQWSLLMAGSLIYTLPAIVVVLIAGRYLVSGLTAGAVKD